MYLVSLRSFLVKFQDLTFLNCDTAVFFSYTDPSEKFQFSNQYNFCSDELFRVKSTKISILSVVLLFLTHK
jgi:hypothetical protein